MYTGTYQMRPRRLPPIEEVINEYEDYESIENMERKITKLKQKNRFLKTKIKNLEWLEERYAEQNKKNQKLVHENRLLREELLKINKKVFKNKRNYNISY